MSQHKEILQKINELVSKEHKSTVQPGAKSQIQKFPNIHGHFLACSKSSNY